MKRNQHSGYAKNYANLEDLISIYREFGAAYNPKLERLSIKGLGNLRTDSADQMNQTRNHIVNFDGDNIKRREAYVAFKALSVKVVNAFSVSGAGKALVDDAKGILRKLRGERAAALKNDNGKPQSTEPPSTSTTNEAATATLVSKERSVSQQDYDNLMENFEKLLALVTKDSSFEAHEPELKFDALKLKLAELKTICADFADSSSKVKSARIKQHELFYHPGNGLVATAQASKIYVKSVFGAKSEEYKRVSKIKFRKF